MLDIDFNTENNSVNHETNVCAKRLSKIFEKKSNPKCSSIRFNGE